MDKVTIIVPVYNAEEYLPTCVASICNQTYGNLEILLVDDGSTDASGIMCDQYAEQDHRIRVFHKKNGGQGSARNMALDNMTGDYIIFVDSDDYIELNQVEFLMNNLKQYNSDISCGRTYSQEDKSDFVRSSDVIVKDNIDAMNTFVRNQDGFDHLPVAKLYKRSTFEGVRFLELRGYEDAGTIFKAFIRAERVVSQPVSVYFYLQRKGSTMHRNFSMNDYDRIRAYKEMELGLRRYDKYTDAADVVTGCKIGAIFYLVGEGMRSHIPKREELIGMCQEESKATLGSGYTISVKNKVLLHLLCASPSLFGLLYKMGHKN